jgi:hypothetical protein
LRRGALRPFHEAYELSPHIRQQYRHRRNRAGSFLDPAGAVPLPAVRMTSTFDRRSGAEADLILDLTPEA